MPVDSVHFNGSVNLADAETVMREIAARVPRGLRRMTDGETGERINWIVFQIHKFEAMPGIEHVGSQLVADDWPLMPVLRVPEHVLAQGMQWPDPGYAAAYTDSYAIFDRLQATGVIPAGIRLQMQYPTPLAPIGAAFAEQAERLVGSYQGALFADLDRALGHLPHDRVAVQWDVALEIGTLVGGYGAPAVPFEFVMPGLVRAVDQVPDDVPVGMHLCYGDAGHVHFQEPESLALQVQIANAVTSAAARPVNWFSFTVPQARRDLDYFAPLADLTTGPQTELYFALVPYYPASQVAGTTADQVAHIDSYLAKSAAGERDWGICTECGMGRVQRDDVPALLDLYRTILDAHGGNP